ncbi:MAG: hypothetical protein KAV82_16395, partial [Phycisphaerae bacterium]|nr:hypothetical protein [Phycisphaerae bacterium]
YGLVAAKSPGAVVNAHILHSQFSILNSSRFPSPHFPFFIFNFQFPWSIGRGSDLLLKNTRD